MGAYILSLMVTLDQECAIQKLFTQNSWQFIRIDQSTSDGCSNVSGTFTLVGKTASINNVADCVKSKDLSDSQPYVSNDSDGNEEIEDEHGDNMDTTSGEDLQALGITVKEELQSGDENQEDVHVEEEGQEEDGNDYDAEDGGETSIMTHVNKKMKRKTRMKASTNNRLVFDNEIELTVKLEAEDSLSEDNANLLALLEELPEIKHISELMTTKCSDSELSSGTLPDIETDTNGYISSLSVYFCKWCQYTFPELKHFEGHKRKGQCFFVCQLCKEKFTFRNFSKYQDHLREHRILQTKELIHRSGQVEKRKRETKTIEEKYAAIIECEKGVRSKSDIAREYNVPSNTLSTWLKNKDSIKKGYQKFGPNRKTMRQEQASESPNISVTGRTGRGRNRGTKTLEEKYAAIIECEKGVRTKSDIAREYDVPSSTLSTWLKNKDSIKKGCQKFGPNRKAMKTGNFDELEEVLLQWVNFFCSNNIHVTGPMIQSKAEELALNMSIDNFKATNGWLDRFKDRHGILFRKVSGEANSVDTNVS